MDTNGYSVQFAAYPGGSFIQTGPLTWRENGSVVDYEFTESARDEWSVYLKDPSRNVSIQLDLWRNKVRYSDSTTPWRDQYDILSAMRPYPGQIQLEPIVDSAPAACAGRSANDYATVARVHHQE